MRRYGLIALVVSLAVPGCSGQKDPPQVLQAPLLGGELSPQAREFAAKVDRICAVNASIARQREDHFWDMGQRKDWPNRKTRALIFEVWAPAQAAMAKGTRRLGQPPMRPRLVERWISNVARRGRLFHRQSVAWARGDFEALHLATLRKSSLKVEADHLGQHFGLRVCTSNGRNAIAAIKQTDYLDRVELVCAQREEAEARYAERRPLDPEALFSLSLKETLRIGSIGVAGDREYELRERLLRTKKELEDERRIHPAEAEAAEDQTAAMGLDGCRGWSAEGS